MSRKLGFSRALTVLTAFLRDNILVLDIFFEALNYETIEQKKAYEVAGLLGGDLLTSIMDWSTSAPL